LPLFTSILIFNSLLEEKNIFFHTPASVRKSLLDILS